MALLIAPMIPHASTSRLLAPAVAVTVRAWKEPGPPDRTRDQMKRPRQAKGIVKAFKVMSQRS